MEDTLINQSVSLGHAAGAFFLISQDERLADYVYQDTAPTTKRLVQAPVIMVSMTPQRPLEPASGAELLAVPGRHPSTPRIVPVLTIGSRFWLTGPVPEARKSVGKRSGRRWCSLDSCLRLGFDEGITQSPEDVAHDRTSETRHVRDARFVKAELGQGSVAAEIEVEAPGDRGLDCRNKRSTTRKLRENHRIYGNFVSDAPDLKFGNPPAPPRSWCRSPHRLSQWSRGAGGGPRSASVSLGRWVAAHGEFR